MYYHGVRHWTKIMSRNYILTNQNTIPVGEYDAKLDFKIWAKKIAGICCYFTQQDTGIKFQLTVYRRRLDALYQLDSCDVDFKTCPVSTLYRIKVGLNGKGNITFKDAVISQAL